MASISKRGIKWRVRIIRTGFSPICKTFITRQDAEKWARLTESELERVCISALSRRKEQH